jgi:UDP-N-acetyl-alpha-D-muramoyl-L-alanyl-L-glutamate epimerase
VIRPARARTFAYGDVVTDPAAGTLTCHFRLDDRRFTEVATFDATVDLAAPGVGPLATLYHLLAGLSYYKAGAARVVELGCLEVGAATKALLEAAIADGLGEFALRNDLDLSDVALRGGAPVHRVWVPAAVAGPLVPFGGGIDSIVSATAARLEDGAALFVVGPREERFAAIERPAQQTGLPVVRCARAIDDAVRHPAVHGFFDGHVPVTAMVSALALVAAAGQRRSAVIMSNERSASSPTVIVGGRAVNHQWSKSLACEELVRAALAERLDGGPSYSSALRDRSELWIAAEFARHGEYLDTFMSCNRAFRHDVATRATTWCGECDKCLFTNLVLAPFVARTRLESIFGGREPLGDPHRTGDLEVLCGLVDAPKPFECVGDADECATALVATAARADRADQRHLAALAARCVGARPLDELLDPTGPSHATTRHAARGLL